MDANTQYRLEFWVNEFNSDPDLTNFQVRENLHNNFHDEIIAEDQDGLQVAGLTQDAVQAMLDKGELLLVSRPDGGIENGSDTYSDRAIYYFDSLLQ